jgi:hypothetical protein
MPKVDEYHDLREVFATARAISAGTEGVGGPGAVGRSVAVVTPGRLVLSVGCPPASAISAEMLGGIRQLVPEHPKQQITVIANNDVVAANVFTAREANGLIPFFGYLLGMAADGHTVVVFEGHPSALSAGCEGATLLLVDGGIAGWLQADWTAVAMAAMRVPVVVLFGRDGSVKKFLGGGGETGEAGAAGVAAETGAKAAPTTGPAVRKRWWWPFGGRG